MKRGSMRETPHDQVRSAQRFDVRVYIRDVLRDRSQDDVRAEGWACVRGGTKGSRTACGAGLHAVPQAESVANWRTDPPACRRG